MPMRAGGAIGSAGRLLPALAAAGAILLHPVAASAEAVELVVGTGSPGAAAGTALDLEDCGFAGGCWNVDNVLALSVTVSAAGQSKTCRTSCRLPFVSTYLIGADVYDIVNPITVQCPSGSTVTLAGGTVARKGRKILLEPENLAALQTTLRSCLVGATPQFTSWLRPSRDGARVRGRTRARGTVRVGSGSARLAFKLKQSGVPTSAGLPPARTRPKECPPELTLRCVLRVSAP